MDSVFKICKKLIIKDPFYGLFLLNLNKRFDSKIQTAGVMIEGINPLLLINKEWWYGLESDEMKVAVLKHECGHLMYGHLTKNWDYLRRESAELTNIAMDTEINGNISDLQKDPFCYPSRYGFEPNKGTLYYYSKLREMAMQNPSSDGSGISFNCPGGEGDNQTMDDHSVWKDLSDAEKELAQQQIDGIAKRVAEQVKRSQGTIPGEFKEYIDELFKIKKRIFDWKSYFRRYLGTVLDIEIKKSRKKESIRFPDASGIKHKRKSQIFVIVDTSGSVSRNDLEDFFSEINHIYKAGAIIDICEIDTKINKIYRYTGKFPGEVHGRGGTILRDGFTHFNEHRRDYTSCVVFTDGYCDVDYKIYGDTMWIIASGGMQQKYPGRVCYINNSEQN